MTMKTPTRMRLRRSSVFSPYSLSLVLTKSLTTRLAAPLRTESSVDMSAAMSADRKSTRLNSSHVANSYAVFCLKKTERIDIAYERQIAGLDKVIHTAQIDHHPHENANRT